MLHHHTDRLAAARQRMLHCDLQGRDIRDPNVLEAMAQVPRERFVPAEYHDQAYDDRPLPIGLGQTISQPYVVALMTQELAPDKDCRVLEIGTGSGYQAAILAQMAKEVYTVERLEPLASNARKILRGLGCKNVYFCVADGSLGWPGPMSFDRIMVTAAVERVPPPLLDQLYVGGLLVAPVGPAATQTLVLFKKTPQGVVQRQICPVRFVKLIGRHGFEG